MSRRFRNTLVAALAALPCAVLLRADFTGAEPRLSGAPGERNCTACHLGSAVNSFSGGVKIVLPGDPTYTPGVKQHIKVQVSDPAQRRWGFELSARLSGSSPGQAGDLASTDSFTQAICDNGGPKPCASPSAVQFITHTEAGTRPGTAGGATFEFDWTPPSTDAGKITLYAAGNAANGDNRNSGDHIYTTSVELSPAAAAPKPSISAEGGVLNAASLQPAIAPNTWLTIKGADLSAATRTWTADEIASGSLPASLEGVSVTVNGKAAPVAYVSPGRINVLSPADDAQGQVEVRVTANGQTSGAAIVNLQPLAPALFTFDGKYAATSPGSNALLDQSPQFFASADPAAAVKPGDTVVLYGTGFGPIDPNAAPDTAQTLLAAPAVTVGGAPATLVSAGLLAGSPQIYRLTILVPDAVPDGDQAVSVLIGGASSQDGVLLKVQR